jgi:hypothetical protein
VGVDGSAVKVRAAARRLATLRGGWWSAAGRPGQALGYAELTHGYQAMVEAWFAELGTYLRILRELPGAPTAAPVPVDDPAVDPRPPATATGCPAPEMIRVGDLAAVLNPLTAPWRITETIDLLGAPPPGDPVRLRALADAFVLAAEASRPLAVRVDRLGDGAPPDTWRTVVAGTARRVLTATGDLIAAVGPAYLDTAEAVRDYADTVEALQRRHEPLRRRLREVWQSVPRQQLLGFTLPVPALRRLPGSTAAATGVLSDCHRIYREQLNAADELSRVLCEVTAQARAQQAWRGGLPAAMAVLIANTAILSVAQLRRATGRRQALDPADRARLDALLADARSADVTAYLLEAFAAGHRVEQVAAFATRIRDLPPIGLHRAVNLIQTLNPGPVHFGAAPVTQLTDDTCGVTSTLVALAAVDPIFALSVTGGLDPDERDGAEAFLVRLRQAEETVDHDANHWGPLPSITTLLGLAGTSITGLVRWMNDHAEVFGTRYVWRSIVTADVRGARLSRHAVLAAVAQGYPVLLCVGDNHIEHAVLVLGDRSGNMLIYEPGYGTVTRASARDFLDGTMTAATTWSTVYGMILPTGT